MIQDEGPNAEEMMVAAETGHEADSVTVLERCVALRLTSSET